MSFGLSVVRLVHVVIFIPCVVILINPREIVGNCLGTGRYIPLYIRSSTTDLKTQQSTYQTTFTLSTRSRNSLALAIVL